MADSKYQSKAPTKEPSKARGSHDPRCTEQPAAAGACSGLLAADLNGRQRGHEAQLTAAEVFQSTLFKQLLHCVMPSSLHCQTGYHLTAAVVCICVTRVITVHHVLEQLTVAPEGPAI